MDHYIFEGRGGGGGGWAITKKYSYTAKVEKKKTCTVGKGEKNRASLSTRRILLDQMKN